MTPSHPTLVVTGASGQLGRRVVELLLEKKAGRVVAVSRNTEKIADLAAKGAELRKADFEDQASLEKAFAGADRLLIVSTDSLEPGRRGKQHLTAIAAAKAAKVGYLVYTSLHGVKKDHPVPLAEDHRITEEALAASGIPLTSLRNNLYTEMFLGSLPPAVQSGQLFSATGTGAAAYVTREDCAQAAAGALASTDRTTRHLDVTGPDAVTHEQLAKLLTEIAGKKVTYVPVTQAQVISGMVGAGVPQPIAELFSTFDVAVSQGLFAKVTDTVQKLSGKAPQSVAQFLQAHAAVLKGQK